MAPISLFIIGSTGHIGGAILDQISKAHPEVRIRVLVRKSDHGERLEGRYPNVTAVLGDYSKFGLLEKEASESQIVINAAPDVGRERSIESVINGLAAQNKKPFYIQNSGAALVWENPGDLKAREKIWDDVANVDDIISRPETANHRQTDKLAFSASNVVHVAVVSPCWVTGLSPSQEHPIPLTIPSWVSACKVLGAPFVVDGGKAITSFVHVVDLARLYLALVDNAINRISGSGAPEEEFWGPKAYYFGASEQIEMKAFTGQMSSTLTAAGAVTTGEIRDVDLELATKATIGDLAFGRPLAENPWASHITLMYAVDMRVTSTRARGLGWSPREKSVKESFAEAIDAFLKTGK